MKKLSRNTIRLLLTLSVFLVTGIIFAVGYVFISLVGQIATQTVKSTYADISVTGPVKGHYKIKTIRTKELVREGAIPDNFSLPPGFYHLELSFNRQKLETDILINVQDDIKIPESVLASPFLESDFRQKVFVGRLYENGWGVEKDEVTALRWYRKAADDNSDEAFVCVGEYYQQGRGGVKQDYKEAMKWYKKAPGLGEACYDIAQLYYNGLGVSRDEKAAIDWFRQAADYGYSPAEIKMGFLYENGDGVEKDSTKAIKWFSKVDERGADDDGVAAGEVGGLYEDGTGITVDLEQAALWLRKAADKGNASAMYRLGEMYLTGKGVDKDATTAKEWIQKAADQGYPEAVDALKKL